MVTNGDNLYDPSFVKEVERVAAGGADIVAVDFYSRYQRPTGGLGMVVGSEFWDRKLRMFMNGACRGADIVAIDFYSRNQRPTGGLEVVVARFLMNGSRDNEGAVHINER